MKKEKNLNSMCLFYVVIIAISACLDSCVFQTNEGLAAGEDQKIFRVDAFDLIDFSTVGEVDFTIGEASSVTIVGDSNFIKKYIVESMNGKLSIRHKAEKMVMKKTPEVRIHITSPSLNKLMISGVGSFNLKDSIESDSMRITLEGTGSLKADHLLCDNLNVKVQGTGSVTLSEITAKTADLSLEGVGNLTANFTDTDTLRCNLYGVGSINLKGNVKSLEKKVDGIGHINTNRLKIGE